MKYVSALKRLGFSKNLNKNIITFPMQLWYGWGLRLIAARNEHLKAFRDVFYDLWLKHVFANRSFLTHGESFCVFNESAEEWVPLLRDEGKIRTAAINRRKDPWVVAKVKEHPTFIKIYDEGMKSSTYFAFTDEKQKERDEKDREEYEAHKKWRTSVPKNDEIWKDKGKGKEKEKEDEEGKTLGFTFGGAPKEEEKVEKIVNAGKTLGVPMFMFASSSGKVGHTLYKGNEKEEEEETPTEWECLACEGKNADTVSYCDTCLSPRKGVVPTFF